VRLFGDKRSLDRACDDVAAIGPTLGKAISRFTRVITVPSPRTTTRAANLAAHFPRIRPAQARRPVRLPMRRAERLRSRTPKTVLAARRGANRRPAIAATVEDGAARVAGAIRDRLRTLRGALLRFRRRLGGSRR